ncbi:MAG: histone [Elusimicrobiota bacterium]
MGKKPKSLTKSEIKNIFEGRAGAKRVSKEAKERLLGTLNELAYEIAYYSVKYSRNEGKKTVSGENVRDATQFVLGGEDIGED